MARMLRKTMLLTMVSMLWPLQASAQFSNFQPGLSVPSFSIQQGADTGLLAGSAVVEFTVTVANIGSGVASPGTATVRLSADLIGTPAGTAPFTSQGTFDLVRGTWDIGILQPGGEALLLLPAQVVAQPQQPCAYSLAELWPDGQGANATSQQAFSTLRAPGVAACSDLVVGTATALPRGFPFCDGKVSILLPLLNRGPDTAHEVFLSIGQEPEKLPGLVFRDARCTNFGEPTCLLAKLAPGVASSLLLESAVFKNKNNRAETTLTATVSSADYELVPGQESSSTNLSIDKFEPCEDFDYIGNAGYASGCFIATAAWGSAMDPHVASLRRFRDRFLLTHAPGRRFVALYYRFSPPLADYIAARPAARAVTRAMLWPLVSVVERPVSLLWLTAGGLWLACWRSARGLARAGRFEAHALCFVALAALAISDEVSAAGSDTARQWPAADHFFHKDLHWLGGDAALSVPLGGERTLWLFGDSFIATSDRALRSESRMIRNSIAIQQGRDPRSASLRFHWRGDQASPESFFPEQGDRWYWPGHGIRLSEGPLVIFLFTLIATPGQDLGFATVGHAVAVIDDPDAAVDTWQPRIRDIPSPGFDALPATALVADGDHIVALAIRQHGTHAGALVRYPASGLAAGRLEEAEWWAGEARGWVHETSLGPEGPAFVLDDAGAECSLHRDERSGWFVHVASYGFGATTIGVRTAPALTGPWSAPRMIYRPPESDGPRPAVYAAKAHPQLAGPDAADLVITYATNSFDFADLFTPRGARELYWPRFVAWRLPERMQAFPQDAQGRKQ